MKRIFLLSVSASVFLSLISPAFSLSANISLREKAFSLKKEGNFKDAFALFRELVFSKEKDSAELAKEFNAAVACLNKLSSVNEIDSFRSEAVKRRSDNWRLLQAAARSFISNQHYGYMIGGSFERGPHRGGGKVVDASDRDRVEALRLYEKAMKLMEKDKTASEYDKYSFYMNFANAVFYGRSNNNSWELQYLTKLSKLPDYEPGYGYYRSSRIQGAPVDTDGNPVCYYLPRSFSAASDDGQRWRFLLEAAAKSCPERAPDVDYIFADFLWSQFGVQTMARMGQAYRRVMDDVSDGPYSVHTLRDSETIARLATGIKRFELPEEFDFIDIYTKIAELKKGRAEDSLTRLAGIFENRRQYVRAAEIWRKNIELFGPGGNAWKKKRLDQITGNWGSFEPVKAQVAGKPAKLDFRFRNARLLKLKARRIKIGKILADLKKYLKDNPPQVQWWYVNIGDIGYRLVAMAQEEYLGDTVAEWRMTLSPEKNHYDKRITVETPFSDPGFYLLEARLEDGNTSRIVLYLADTVILSKNMNDKKMYYVSDALTGKPLSGADVNFFGYRNEYIKNQPRILSLIRKYNVLVKEFSKHSGENGIVEAASPEMDRKYQWFVSASTKDGRTAFLNFSGAWFASWRDREYNQKKIYCITDRPVYRPGQKVDFKYWVRKARYDLEGSFYAHMPFTVIIRNPKNETVLKKSFTSDSLGGFDGNFVLPADAALGNYRIYIENWGGHSSFRVEEYKKPEYEVKVEAPSRPVELGEKISALIKAEYYFGAPVTDAKVKYKVRRYEHDVKWYPPMYWDWLYGPGYWWFAYDYNWLPGWRKWGCVRPCPWWIPYRSEPPELVMENEVPIGPDGTVKIEIDTSVAKAFFGEKAQRYEITAEVVDLSRRTIVGKGSVIVSPEPFKVYCWTNRGWYSTGDTVDVSFAARTPDGKPVSGKGEARLFRISYDSNGQPSEMEVQSWELDSDSEGKASLKINATQGGQYRIAFTLTSADSGQSITGASVFEIRGEKINPESAPSDFRFNAVELVCDKKEYAPGDELELVINTAAEDSSVLLFLRPSQGMYREPELIRIKGKSARRKIRISKSDMPNFFIEALTVHDARIHTALKEIVVPPEKRVLNVEVFPSKKKYQPGEKAKLKIRITGFSGDPVDASTVITVYDKAVEYISGGSNVPAIKEFFWKWRRRHYERTFSNLMKEYFNLLKKGETTLGNIGIFGDIVNSVGGRSRDSMTAGAPMRLCKSSMEFKAKGDVLCEAAAPTMSDDEGGAGSGSDSTADLDVKVRKNFADTAFWCAKLSPDKDGVAEVEFDMPENLSTWKITAWSLTNGTRVGQGETEVITTKDFILRMQCPRFFVETDEVVLSAIVHNYTSDSKRTKLLLSLEGGTLSCLDGTSREISVEAGGEKRVNWRVKAVKEGEAVITMKAASSGASDAMQMKFPVLVHGMEKMESFTGSIPADEKNGIAKITVNVPEKCRLAETRLQLNFSPTLAGAMLDALPYLAEYPYGCTEQTLNRFLPSVITRKVLREMKIDLSMLKDKRTNLNSQELGDDRERAAQWKRWNRNPVFNEKTLDDMIAEGLKRLSTMQNSDGGWGWFSGYGEISWPHTTAQVVRGLLIASENGVGVDGKMLGMGLKWLEAYQEQEVVKLKNAETKNDPWKKYADNIDAFVFSVLSKAGKANPDMNEFLYRDREYLSVYGKALYGLGLFRIKDREKLDMIMRNISQYLVKDAENQTAYLKMDNASFWWCWYGSETEAMAAYLRLLVNLNSKDPVCPMLVKYLLNNRKHATYWNSTRDTALCVEAFADYLRRTGENKPDMNLKIFYDGKLVKEEKITPSNIFSFDSSLILRGKDIGPGKHTVEIRREGRGPVYYNAYLTYFTLENFIKRTGLEIKVRRFYYRLKPVEKTVKTAGSRGQVGDMKVEKYERIPLENLSELKSGELVEIELIIESKNDYEYLVFEDMKPAGFEPCEVRSGYNGNSMGAYVEFRDERVCFFVRRLARGKHSVSYRMRAEIPGRFSALPARGSAMYAPELKGNSDEIKLIVVDD